MAKKEKTEEEKKREEEGRAYIKEREKRAGEIMRTGASAKAAQQQAMREITAREEEALAPERAKEETAAAAEKLLLSRKLPPEELLLKELPPEELPPKIEPQLVEGEKRGILESLWKGPEAFEGERVMAGTVPISTVGLPVSNIAVATNTAKAKIATTLAAKASTHLSAAVKWGATLFGIKTIADVPEKQMTDVLAELRIMKQEGRTNTKMIVLGPEFALDVLDNIDTNRLTLNEYERKIKYLKNLSYTQKLLGYGKFGETQDFIESLRRYYIPIEQLAARAVVGGEVTPEEIALLLQEVEE